MNQPRRLGLLAPSNCARAIEDALPNSFGHRADAARAKLRVLHPPQAIGADAEPAAARAADNGLRLAFVGNSFVRKSGREMLRALCRPRERAGLTNFHLTIVSSLHVDPDATGETAHEMQALRGLTEANASWITWHRQLPNDKPAGCRCWDARHELVERRQSSPGRDRAASRRRS